ncbi:MAG: hypothetical protein ACI89U_000403 [Gammaproteobacteria bacterium]|jgi:hypothetical protein
MDIYDLKVEPIERIESASVDEVLKLVSEARRPVIFSGLDSDFEFLQKWDLDFFAKLDTAVPVQRPEPDGVNYFVKYQETPMKDFVNRIRDGENLYIGAKQILRNGGLRSDKDGLGVLAEHLTIPPWVERSGISTANLWIGAGNNHTLLHYDPWNTILMLAKGKKEFIVLPERETSKVYPYGALNFWSLYLGKVLHSKIRPLNIQKRYQAKFSKAEGFRGIISAGEMIFIPAGYWHYVKSSELNIGINFFINIKDSGLRWTQPLRSFWIKDNITLWPVRMLWKLKYKMFRSIRYFFPKKNSEIT